MLYRILWYKNLAIANRSRVSCTHNVEGVTLKSGLMVTQGHWKRNRWIHHTRLRPISRVFLTLNIRAYRDLEMWVRGHWNVSDTGTIRKLGCSVLFAFHSNYGVMSWQLRNFYIPPVFIASWGDKYMSPESVHPKNVGTWYVSLRYPIL